MPLLQAMPYGELVVRRGRAFALDDIAAEVPRGAARGASTPRRQDELV